MYQCFLLTGLCFDELVDSSIDIASIFGHGCSGEPAEITPKKHKRLLLVHLPKGDIPLKEGSLFSSWVPVSISGLYDE